MGLSLELFASIRSQLLTQTPLLSLNRAYQQVCQKERVRGMGQARDDREVLGFAINADGRSKAGPGKTDRSGVVCGHCNLPGHEISRCFEIVGYPEWWGDRPMYASKGGGRGRGSVTCDGGTAGRGRGAVRAHAATIEGTSSGRSDFCEEKGEDRVIPGFTPDKWKAFLATFGKTNTHSDRVCGTFDNLSSGATNHVTGNVSQLYDITEIDPCSVGLPDGQKVNATKQGSIRLTDMICLHNVLFVPKLSCSLISVSQLTKDLDCFVQFTFNVCAIQDRRSRRLIGAGERRNGLYYFRDTAGAQIFGAHKEEGHMDVWHCRLGHPSETIMKWLPV
ncbi:unnamed protein product [Cuscuta epithymum]|uniref:Retrovirus-related Pol polyprotein from transposon TNT 1-94-like beta-barrel domain-containing protein n=1 Tax=Cuscuta epithymum TaxID=186058 RepID=A0AAV0EIM1_9ASTE|nr:unnamed protein product [Cuscuta epithymum]